MTGNHGHYVDGAAAPHNAVMNKVGVGYDGPQLPSSVPSPSYLATVPSQNQAYTGYTGDARSWKGCKYTREPVAQW